MDKIYIKPAPIIVPTVTDEYDSETSEFVVRHYDNRYFDKNGDEIFDYKNDD